MRRMISFFLSVLLTLSFLGGCAPGGKKQVAGKQDASPPPKESMDDAEKKLSSDLLALVNDQFLPANTSRDSYLEQQQALGSVLEATKDNASALCAYVYVQLAKDTAMDTVTPYLFELRNKDEKNRLIAAYVEVDRLKELAERQEVVSIRAVAAPITN